MDIDHNGRVTVEEFMAWFKSTKGQIKPAEIQAARELKEHKLKNFVKKVQNIKNLRAKVKSSFFRNSKKL